jgi:hypothetical protein
LVFRVRPTIVEPGDRFGFGLGVTVGIVRDDFALKDAIAVTTITAVSVVWIILWTIKASFVRYKAYDEPVIGNWSIAL